MSQYTHLTYQERVLIFNGIKEGKSHRELAALIGRNPSTVGREIKRNSRSVGYFHPETAQHSSQKGKARHGPKVMRHPALMQYVREKLRLCWSPQAVAGRWSKDHPELTITAEAIYSFIYSKEGKALKLWELLPRKKQKRGIIRSKKKTSTIPQRVSIHTRPVSIHERTEAGHFEVDLFFQQGNQSANTVNCIERKSRFIIMKKNTTKSTNEVMPNVIKAIRNFAKSVTFDNGGEFAQHTLLSDQGIATYFCDPGAPYQKGSVEQSNGMLRRYFPFKVTATSITQHELDRVAAVINHIPRKILNYLTPCEVLSKDFNLKNWCVALHY